MFLQSKPPINIIFKLNLNSKTIHQQQKVDRNILKALFLLTELKIKQTYDNIGTCRSKVRKRFSFMAVLYKMCSKQAFKTTAKKTQCNWIFVFKCLNKDSLTSVVP